MSKNRVVLIIPYFGKFPNYFNYWLKSAYSNSDFDFLIFTDNKEYKSQKNITFINCTFANFKKALQKQISFKIELSEPYKLCDYRPLFGKALQKYISNYEFWGFCDVDLIFGELNQFITSEILDNYDKIYNLGHLTILKNNELCNNLWSVKHHLKNAYRYDEAFKTKYTCHFDEMGGLTQIAKLKNVKTYENIDFADVDPRKFNFRLIGRKYPGYKSEFYWKKGQLFYIYKENIKTLSCNIMYAHFQKRNLDVKTNTSISKDTFVIIPNKFILNDDPIADLDEINKNNFYSYYYKDRIKRIMINIFKRRALQQRFYRNFIRPFFRKKLDSDNNTQG